MQRYDPDPLRYLLSINMPETGDTDFSWREFLRRNNDELVATYGNLVHRVLTFTHRNFDGTVPTPDELDNQSKELINKAHVALEDVDRFLSRCQFKGGIKVAMALAQEANRYLDNKAPWKAIKHDRQSAATTVYVVLSLLSVLKIMLYPFLPFSSQKLHNYLGFDGDIGAVGWNIQLLPSGQKLQVPQPLFTKLDDSIVDEETSRLRGEESNET